MATQEDFDWLYGRTPEKQTDKTQVMPTSQAPASTPAPQTPVPPPATVVPAPAPAPAPRPAPRDLPPVFPKTTPAGNAPVPPGMVPPRGGSSAAASTPKRRRKIHWMRWLIGLIVLALVASIVFWGSVALGAWNNVEKIDDDPGADRPAAGQGTTFLLVGNDKRGGLTPEEAAKLGIDSETEGDRTDTMMLVHIPQKGKPVMVSLPRDSFLAIPGHGKKKLNAAYGLGGAPLLIGTIEKATGVRIDGYVEVGFGGFARVVEAIDGIDVCVDHRIPGAGPYPEILPGCQHMDTVKALWFVRNRNAQEGQDLGRVQRQRKFLAAAIKGVASPATFTNPSRYLKTTDAFSKALAVGKHTELGDMVTLATGMQRIGKGDGYSLTVPISSANTRTSAGSSVIWDKEQCQEMFGMIARGDTTGIEKFVKK